MSGRQRLPQRLVQRLRACWRSRAPEPSVRELIAELVQEAAAAPQTPGEPPELDRHERALINNILRLRGNLCRRRDDPARRHHRHPRRRDA